MQPRTTIDSVRTPQGVELVLTRRDGVFEIDVDGYDLMSSRVHGSEEEMARLALAALGGRRAEDELRILVGGLGMGYTLRALLDALGSRRAKVEVAEVFAAVVEWNRTHLAELAGRPLDDRRVNVTVGDVGERLGGDERWDVVLLDVDNGPEALTLRSNEALYSAWGLDRLHRALAPGGVLAVWSSYGDPRFVRRLAKAGFAVEQRTVRSREGTSGRRAKGRRDVVFLAEKRAKRS